MYVLYVYLLLIKKERGEYSLAGISIESFTCSNPTCTADCRSFIKAEESRVFHPQPNQNQRSVLDELFQSMPGVVSGELFGYPAWYVNDTVFACLHENGLAIRLQDDVAKELMQHDGFDPFRPSDAVFRLREWVTLVREPHDTFGNDLATLRSSYAHAFMRGAASPEENPEENR